MINNKCVIKYQFEFDKRHTCRLASQIQNQQSDK